MKLSVVIWMLLGCLPLIWGDNRQPVTWGERERVASCTTLRNTLFHLLTVMSNRSVTARPGSWLNILHKKAKICFPSATTGRPTVLTTTALTAPPVKTGEDKDRPGTSCKAIRDENPEGSSGLYWIKQAVGEAFQVYCDQETDGGGWTLVYSYRFTNYSNFRSGTNAITPRPSWPAIGDVPESRTVPFNETQGGAMSFSLWKQIGHEFMAKSNINHWIVCEEGSGSLVEYRAGTLSCRVVRNIGTKCLGVAPDELRVLTKESAGNYGPHLYNSKSPTFLKTYYYWESSTQSRNWPTHDPCGQNSLSHVKNVSDPHGNIYIR